MARTAAVVGGGIGGLAVAIGLRSKGWEVTVFERAGAHPTTGTGLGIWPSALRALDRLGLGERARQVGRPQASGAIRRPGGSRIAVLDMDRVKRKHGEPVYLLSRPALLGLLSGALPAEVVQFGAHVTADLREQYDIVIGADGINSGVRKSIFGDRYGLRYAGMTAWRGVVDLETEVGGETWGRGMKFGITPQEDGRTNWYAVLAVEEGYKAASDELQRRFGAWHDPIPKILADQEDAIRHDLHYLDPPLPSFVDGNVALLGDAAHAMTPDLGQGACQALIDGVALADCLADDGEGGLKAYDKLRRKPAQRIAAMALRASKLPDAFHTIARCSGETGSLIRPARLRGGPKSARLSS